MPFQLSPAVNVTEIDLTGFIPAVATTGAAFVGQFAWGAVDDYTIISNRKQLERYFGKPNDVNYRDWFTCSNFLSYSNNINIIRVVDEAVAKNATVDGTGILIKNESNHSGVIGTPAANIAKVAARYPSDLGNSLDVVYIDSNTWRTNPEYRDIEDLFDGKPATSAYCEQVGGKNDEIHIAVIDRGGLISGIPNQVLETFPFCSKAKDGRLLDGEPSFYGTVINVKSDYIWFLDSPDDADMAIGGEITSIAVADGGSDYTSAPLITISGEGTGAQATAVLAATGHAKEVTVNDGGTGYAINDVVVLANGIQVTVDSVNSGVIDAITLSQDITSLTSDVSGVTSTGGSGTGALFDVEVGFKVDSITVDNGGADYVDVTTVVTIDPPTIGGTQATATFNVVGNPDYDTAWEELANGAKFKSLKTEWHKPLSGGANSDIIDANELIRGWDMFKNAEIVDVSLLLLGDAGEGMDPTTPKVVIKHVVDNIANVRKDCVAFFGPKKINVVDINEVDALENVVDYRNDINLSSSYAFMDSTWKYQYDVYNDKYRWLPMNGDIAGLCAYTDSIRDPWWSPAGFNRGQIKNCLKLAFNPNKGARDELYKNSINPVVSFKGEGIVLFGDRTQLARASAFQKLNVRRLFIVLEKAISTASKYLLFEFNDSFTRQTFVNMVTPYLRDVVGRRGIYDFRVVCDESNNTGEVIDRSEFVADIYVKPAMSINFIQLSFISVRNGVSFDEVVGKF